MSDKPVKREQLKLRKLGNEVLIYDQDGGNVHVLNETAGMILQLCDGKHSITDIESEIRNCFDVGKCDARTDVVEIIKQFNRIGLVEKGVTS